MPVEFFVAYVGEVVKGAVAAAVEMVETSVEGIMAEMGMSEMPLSYHRSVSVSVVPKHVGEGPLPFVKAAFAPGRYDGLAEAEP